MEKPGSKILQAKGKSIMKDKPDYLGHRKRIREKYLKSGIDSMHEYEALELLLTYAIPRKNVKPIAKRLIHKYKNITGILSAELSDLKQIPELGDSSAILLKLIKDLAGLYLAGKAKLNNYLKSPQEVINFCKIKIGGMQNECIMLIYMNAKNAVLGHEIIDVGVLDSAVSSPRQLIEKSIKNKAHGIILVHNHPSGNCEPSDEDKKFTEEIQEACKLFDIRFLDHIIVSSFDWYSFKERDIIK